MTDYESQTDESLMIRISRGDHQAFAVLVRRHTSLFFSAAYRMCGHTHEAEDIVQEAFCKLWERPDTFDSGKGTKFTTWFYRVVTNLAIDKGRQKKPMAPADTLDIMADKTPLAEAHMLQQEQHTALERAIQTLPERQKIALNLCFYEGLSNKEAAHIMGVGVKALESLLIRAKKTLQDDLTHAGLIEAHNTKGRKVSHAG